LTCHKHVPIFTNSISIRHPERSRGVYYLAPRFTWALSLRRGGSLKPKGLGDGNHSSSVIPARPVPAQLGCVAVSIISLWKIIRCSLPAFQACPELSRGVGPVIPSKRICFFPLDFLRKKIQLPYFRRWRKSMYGEIALQRIYGL